MLNKHDSRKRAIATDDRRDSALDIAFMLIFAVYEKKQDVVNPIMLYSEPSDCYMHGMCGAAIKSSFYLSNK